VPLASIRTLLPRSLSNRSVRRFNVAASVAPSAKSFLCAAVVLVCLAFVLSAALDATVPVSRRSRRKIRKPKPAACLADCLPQTIPPAVATPTPEDATLEQQLSTLARNLHNAVPGSYEKLAAFAAKNAGSVWGARAALPLGYDDYSKRRFPQALIWFDKAKTDTLLLQYSLFWKAQTEQAIGRVKDALADFNAIQTQFPDTALKEQLVDAFANASVEAGHPQDGIDALNSYAGTAAKTPLLLDRARAYRAARQYVRAAKDFETIFYSYPLSDEAKSAGEALTQLRAQLRGEFPYITGEMQLQRAQAFFDAKKWRDARREFEKLIAMLKDPANPVRQRAQLRVAQCRVELRSSLRLVSSLKTPSPDVDAERLYVLSQFQRTAQKEAEMFSSLNALQQKYPESPWAEEGLMAEANYYWVQLDRVNAAKYYQLLLDTHPKSKYAYTAQWRVAWVAYLNRQPDADDKLQAFLLRYPVSADAVDAIYWLGRDAERNGNSDHARSFYVKAVDRYPQTYFGRAAAQRLASLGPGQENPADFLDQIPAPPPLPAFDQPIPPAAQDRWDRAQALRSIAFDSAAEQELKNGFFATGSPRFLLAAAQAAFDQGHFGVGMAYARVIVPDFDARQKDDLPLEVWKTLYPLPYEDSLRRDAEKNGVDPMLVAGLIRQESTFQADAVSYANAIGLMQLLPKTGRKMSRALHVRYVTSKLFDPDFNLLLGTYYLKGLVDLTGSPEAALAAYNAGEDRIAAWQAERKYDDLPELVESIPFSQTRDYVQIVLRNAEVYRMIYGPQQGKGDSADKGNTGNKGKAAPSSSPSPGRFPWK
jgi:soluble lytic murein transglycosylase